MKNKMSVKLGIFAFLLVFSLASAIACSCIPPRDVQTELNESYAVFQGRVVEMDESMMNYEYTVTLDVEKSWKGISEETIEVKTALDSAACGYPFELNNTYLVYAVQFEGDTWVYSCGRTALLEDAEADLAELGAPSYEPAAVLENEERDEQSFFNRIKAWFSNLFN